MKELDRRSFLKAGLLAGFAATVPMLKGCGSSGGDSKKTAYVDYFHLDLAEVVGTHPGEGGDYYVSVGGRKSKLIAHNSESIRAIPSGLLGEIGSAIPTHYSRSHSLPTDSVALIILHHHSDDGVHSKLHYGLYVPGTGFSTAARSGGAKVVASAATCLHTTSTSDSFQPDKNLGHVYADLKAPQTAACLLFLHPELATSDPVATSRIAQHIWVTDEFYDLYCHILQCRSASNGGDPTQKWAELVGAVDFDGNPILDSQGFQISHVNYTDKTKELLGKALKTVLKRVKDDPLLTDKNYRSSDGVPIVDVTTPDSALQAPKSLLDNGVESGSNREVVRSNSEFSFSATINEGSWKHGIKWFDLGIEDAETRQLKFSLLDMHLRNFSIYIEYLDADGKSINIEALENWQEYLPEGACKKDWVAEPLKSAGFSTSSLKFVDVLFAPASFMGVRLPLAKKTYKPKMPPNAVTMRIRVGSAGLPITKAMASNADHRRVYAIGLALTLLLNVSIPAYAIYQGLGETENEDLWSLIKEDPAIWVDIFLSSMSLIDAMQQMFGDTEGDSDSTIDDLVAGLTNVLMDLAINGAQVVFRNEKLREFLIEKLAKTRGEEAIPIAGQILQAAALSFSVANLLETTVEMLASPLTYEVDFKISRPIRVKILHDRTDFRFPEGATLYSAEVHAAGTTKRVWARMPETTQTLPLTVEVPDVPTGGEAVITVTFYDDFMNQVAHGKVVFIKPEVSNLMRIDFEMFLRSRSANSHCPDWAFEKLRTMNSTLYTSVEQFYAALYSGLTDDQKDFMETIEIDIFDYFSDTHVTNEHTASHNGQDYQCLIKNLPYPINSSTYYLHKEKIAVSAGKRAWSTSGTPVDTIVALAGIAGSASLHGLGGMTLIQRTGQLGYVWRQSGDNFPSVDSGSNNVPLYAVQNIGLGQTPQDYFQRGVTNGHFSGYSNPLGIVYDLHGPSSGRGRNFIVVPSGEKYHLRHYQANGKIAMELSATKSWGAFYAAPAALAYHPQGYIVSVSSTYSKLEILSLPSEAHDDIDAPLPVSYGGQGSQCPGLLHHPIALGVDKSGIIHVLSAGVRIVQAFDINGQPCNCYGKGQIKANNFKLPSMSDVTTFLDMAVTASGHIYVLGYANNGFRPEDYLLYIYSIDGSFVTKLSGITAGKMLVDSWNCLYTLNYERIQIAAGTIEPTISTWIPQTPN